MMTTLGFAARFSGGILLHVVRQLRTHAVCWNILVCVQVEAGSGAQLPPGASIQLLGPGEEAAAEQDGGETSMASAERAAGRAAWGADAAAAASLAAAAAVGGEAPAVLSSSYVQFFALLTGQSCRLSGHSGATGQQNSVVGRRRGDWQDIVLPVIISSPHFKTESPPEAFAPAYPSWMLSEYFLLQPRRRDWRSCACRRPRCRRRRRGAGVCSLQLFGRHRGICSCAARYRHAAPAGAPLETA